MNNKKNNLKKKNKMIIIVFFTILFVSCKSKSTIYFYSLDRSQCITVISEYDYRYIIAGKHNQLPDTNYIKLRLQDRNSMFDNLYICWNNGKYEWDVVNEYSKILESKLDTFRFNFDTELPKDERGITTAFKFNDKRCATYLFSLRKMIPDDAQGAIVEYK